MRPLVLLAALLVATGCSNKPTAEVPSSDHGGPAAQATGPTPQPQPDSTAKDRAYWLNAIRSTNQKTRAEAIEELAAWAETDPEAVAGLLELLKDRTTAGAGRTHPKSVNSTREAAVRALLLAGPKGEAALRDKGLAALRDGLNDPSAAVREHTVYTIGLLGPLGRPLSAEVQKLCTSGDAAVRGLAFDTLRHIGISDGVGFVSLLTHAEPEVARLAAELAPTLTDLPEAAVPPLTAALTADDATVRTAAAAALAAAGPKAAPAAPALAEAIKKTYPAEFDPTAPYEAGPDLAFWDALAGIGEPAVAATTGLLKHGNPVVRTYAALTLGRIGPPAKAAAADLKAAFRDPFATVALEAAAALCRLGTDTDAAVALIKQALDAPNDVAQTAIEVVARTGAAGQDLLPDALAKLASPNPFARFAAVGLVGTLAPNEATKHAAALGKLARDTGEGAPNPAVAEQARRAIRLRVGTVLEKLGPAAGPAAAALAEAIPTETDEATRGLFLDALVQMGPAAKPAVPVLLDIANDAGTSAERRAKLLLAASRADPASKDVAAAVLAASRDDPASLRAAAAAAAAYLDPLPPDLASRLVAMANSDRATAARVAALKALAQAGPRAKGVRADVEKVAAGKLPEFALLAKVALAAIDGNISRAAADVRAGLTDRNGQTRALAAESLLLIGPTAEDVPALLRLFKDRAAAAQHAAARCVARIGPPAKDAVPDLVKLLDHPEGEVRAAAAAALGELGPAAFPAVPKLKELRGDARLSDPIAGPAARKALEKLGVEK